MLYEKFTSCKEVVYFAMKLDNLQEELTSCKKTKLNYVQETYILLAGILLQIL